MLRDEVLRGVSPRIEEHFWNPQSMAVFSQKVFCRPLSFWLWKHVILEILTPFQLEKTLKAVRPIERSGLENICMSFLQLKRGVATSLSIITKKERESKVQTCLLSHTLNCAIV